ncbi:MAG: hypothetical protein HFF52_02985 [Lawsonibacter sp.]|nr:hypothetical protein [Lawsonibacter sp.]
MKQKLTSLLLALLSILSLTVPVSADIIWEPNDSFFEKHRDECTYVDRRYSLAGYDGTVTIFTAPGGMGKGTLDNGTQCTIQFTWEGADISWGYLYGAGDSSLEGWVPMDDLSLIYDSQQFIQDHAGELTETELVSVDFHEAVCYRYPNGPSGTVLKESLDYQPFNEMFSQLYTDENGLRWGYVGYYMGWRNSWICLDDPMNPELNTGIVPNAPSPAQLRGSATVTAGPPALLIAALSVAGVAAVTGVLLLRLKKRRIKET